MAMLVVSTDAGDIAIQEHEISTITAAELCQLRISRADLRRLFAEAAKLLQGIKPRDRALLVAIRALDGHWEVHTDPHHETAALEENRPNGSIFGWAVGQQNALGADRCHGQTLRRT